MKYLVITLALVTISVIPKPRSDNLKEEHQERVIAYHFINTYGTDVAVPWHDDTDISTYLQDTYGKAN